MRGIRYAPLSRWLPVVSGGLTLFAFLALFVVTPRPAAAQEEFLRGDVNTDGRISISDSLMLRRWLFNGDRPPPCHDAADFDNDGHEDLRDQILVLVYLFLGGESPAAPYPEVGPDTPDDDAIGCAAYDVVEPVETEDLIRIDDIEAAPGEEVRIPVLVSNSVEVEAFQIVVAYDPEVLEVQRVDQPSDDPGLLWGGTFYESLSDNKYPYYFTLTPDPDEGIFVVGFIPDLIATGSELPPGNDVAVFHVPAVVSPEVQPGTSISLEPTNLEDNLGYGRASLRNELTHRGEARYVSVEPRLEGGIMKIVVDQMFFRGDANRDAVVDLSDAQYTLGFLFTGGPRPLCLDAADSNDDGNLDISDPIHTLSYLFLGGPMLPPPFPLRGSDPTSDDPLGCLGSTE